MNEARLILTCGLPGAGKSTLARQLAADRSRILRGPINEYRSAA